MFWNSEPPFDYFRLFGTWWNARETIENHERFTGLTLRVSGKDISSLLAVLSACPAKQPDPDVSMLERSAIQRASLNPPGGLETDSFVLKVLVYVRVCSLRRTL